MHGFFRKHALAAVFLFANFQGGEALRIHDDKTVTELAALCRGQVNKNQQLKGKGTEAICNKLKGGSANLLIFGTGWDSPFWLQSNPNGTTFFLENHDSWLRNQPDSVKDKTFLVKYSTHLRDWHQEIDDTELLAKFLEHEVPEKLKHVVWDVILVDSPEGYKKKQPGRGQSIYAASKLAGPETTIFVDDCERDLERAFMNRWLVATDTASVRQYDGGHSGDGLRDVVCEVHPQDRRAAAEQK